MADVTVLMFGESRKMASEKKFYQELISNLFKCVRPCPADCIFPSRVHHLPVEDISGEWRIDVGQEGGDHRVAKGQDEVASVGGQLRVERDVAIRIYLHEKCVYM